MRSIGNLVNYTVAAVGVVAVGAMLLAYNLLEILRPKMVAFEPLTANEESLVNYIGVGLLLTMLFCILALARIIHHSSRVQRLTPFHLLVVACGVITLLFVFGDVALLNDIGKQYEHGMSQPEWTVLYTVLTAQIVAIALLLYAVLFTLKNADANQSVAIDSSIYLLAQLVGTLCGGIGFAFTLLNFFFPRPLQMVQQQMLLSLIFLLAPYGLIVVWWSIVKWREGGGLFDEKQRQDVGASSFITLVISIVAMTAVYLFGMRQESDMASTLWYPLYAYLALLIFSAANLIRSSDNLRYKPAQ